MYYVSKQMEIAGCHHLDLHYESKCKNLHGHNWIITVFCKAEKLDQNGMIIDLGPLGKLYPSVSGKWVEKEEDLALADLTPHCNYRPSQEVSGAIKGATIGWATAKDEGETEPTDDNTNTGTSGGGIDTSGDMEG